MTTKILMLTACFATAATAAGITAAPATAKPAVTIRGAANSTITARAADVQANTVCALQDVSTGKSVSGTAGADGTVTLVLTNMRRGPHAVNVTCTIGGTTQVLADHWPAPITGR